MNPRYIAWVILKSLIGSLLMFDSLLTTTKLLPGSDIAVALIRTGNASSFFAGFFIILSALIGGFGILTEKYHWKAEEEVLAC